MKTIWNIMSIIAMGNLLGLALFVGWLAASGRLNAQRVEALRQTFGTTIAQEAQRQAEERAQAEALQRESEQREQLASLGEGEMEPGEPIDPANLLAVKLELSDVDLQRRARLERDLRVLEEQIEMREQALERQSQELALERAEFDQLRARADALAADKQFRKTLATLAEMRPDDATAVIVARARSGASVSSAGATGSGARTGADDAVDLLNGMEDDQRAAVLSKILAQDAALAGQLLASLQRLGQAQPASGAAGASARSASGDNPSER